MGGLKKSFCIVSSELDSNNRPQQTVLFAQTQPNVVDCNNQPQPTVLFAQTQPNVEVGIYIQQFSE